LTNDELGDIDNRERELKVETKGFKVATKRDAPTEADFARAISKMKTYFKDAPSSASIDILPSNNCVLELIYTCIGKEGFLRPRMTKLTIAKEFLSLRVNPENGVKLRNLTDWADKFHSNTVSIIAIDPAGAVFFTVKQTIRRIPLLRSVFV
jgi:hypothetical protein